jgi:hypothetical protein
MLNRITDPLDTASTVLPALLPPDARAIVPAPQKKAMCQAKLTTGKEVYHAAIAEYTKKNIVRKRRGRSQFKFSNPTFKTHFY